MFSTTNPTWTQNEAREHAKNALRYILPLLKKHHLDRYVITGGFAVYAYGVERPLTDIDFDIDTSIESAEFKAFMADPDVQKYLTQPLEYFKCPTYDTYSIELTFDGVLLDICPMAEEHNIDPTTGSIEPGYPTGFPDHEIIDFEGIKLSLLSKQTIIEQKKRNNRDKWERRDVTELEKLINKPNLPKTYDSV